MSLLDGLLGNHADHSGVASALLEHLNTSGAGELTNLLQGFNRAGLDEQAQSWVSTSANQPVSPDQVQQGLGDGLLNSLAARAGVSPTVAKVALAAALPLIVDHLTPQGNVPDQSSLTARIGGLLRQVA